MKERKKRPGTPTAAAEMERIKSILKVKPEHRKSKILGPTKAPKHFAEVDK